MVELSEEVDNDGVQRTCHDLRTEGRRRIPRKVGKYVGREVQGGEEQSVIEH